MKAKPKFERQDKAFWAHVRSISQHCGYTENRELPPQEFRQTKRGAVPKKRKSQKIPSRVKVPSFSEIRAAMEVLNLRHDHLLTATGEPTEAGRLLREYFQHRAEIINGHIQAHLMDATEAEKLYRETLAKHPSDRPPPMNKQKGEKKAIAFLTATTNLLIEAAADGVPCEFDP